MRVVFPALADILTKTANEKYMNPNNKIQNEINKSLLSQSAKTNRTDSNMYALGWLATAVSPNHLSLYAYPTA